MKDDLHMDNMFREKFEDFSVEPPAHVWNNIQEQMVSRRRKKRMAYIGWISAAAVVVFAFIAGWMLNDSSSRITETVVERQTQQVQPTPETSEPETAQAIEPASSDKQLQQTASKLNEERAFSANENAFVAEVKTTGEVQPAITTSDRQIGNYELLEARNEIQFVIKQNELAEIRRVEATPGNVEILPESDRVLIAENVQRLNNKKEKDNAWIVGAHVSPGYSAHSSSYSNDYAQNMNEVQNGGVSNVGGGISIQYKTNTRLSIESGVYYAQNSQSAGASNSLFSAPMYDYSADMNLAADAPSYANNVSVTRDGIAMNSTAGVVKMKGMPAGAEINAKTESLSDSYATTMVSDGEFSQVFDFIEIPVYLRYKLLDHKFGIDLMGGLSAGMIVGNNAYMENDYGRQNIGTTEDISSVNISGTLGLGFNYDLGRHFSLAMEPRVNYFLNSINTNPDIDYKPYRFGWFTGVYYTF
ncbi:outer membrane beta-barrel protein [Maribellus sediminis]|uniref:outer membrane beta-barrel protein n=1 Tax=Maribellus sediminis TaxID=2696285 RepID=UPI00142F9525|nr:outer membrane beta-barrel protein [Maribellus sediminis]